MIEPIDGVNSNSSSTVEYTPTFARRAVAAQDSVVLSLDAQAKVLEQQGMSVEEIADQLGIASATVQTDLGLTIVSTQTNAAKA
jgi:DNA-directed RNA polymerase specialized sigma24 family protein